MRNARAKNVCAEEDLVALGRADLLCYARWPLGLRGDYEPWSCQKQWLTIIQDRFEAKLKDPYAARHLCLLAPSEHGKTTSMVLPFVLWALSNDRNRRVIICGSIDQAAANVGYGIDRHFANHRQDMSRFGLEAGYPWNAYEKYIVRDNDALIHPSVLCVGPESEFQGKRADVIVCTDMATFKNQRSPETRQKMLDFLDHTLLPRLEPWGFIIVEGHHVHAEDLYTELEAREEEWEVLKYKAIIEEPCEDNKGKGKVLAPERWSYRELHKIRQRRPPVFQLIYQNIPVETRGLVNRELLERGLDRSRPLLYNITPEARVAYKTIAMGVDPAFTINKWSSFSAALVFGITETGHRDLLGGWRLRILPHILRSKIIQTIMAFMPDEIFIEANAAQTFFVEEVRSRLGGLARRVKPVYTLGGDPLDSVEEAVSQCVMLIETGMATFPYQGMEGQELTEKLLTEIVNFPSGRFTDVMMAWQIMERGLKKLGSQVNRTLRFAGVARSVAALRRNSPFRQGAPFPFPKPPAAA